MAENKLIIGSLPVLRGAYDSATNYYRDNQVTMYGSTFQSVVDENVGYPPAELREDGKVYAINTDKWIIVANAIEAYNAGERIANAETRIKELGEYADSPEFIRVYTDANGKFLWGIRADGTVEWAKGVPTPVQKAIRELEDKLKTQDIKSLQDAIDNINKSLDTVTTSLIPLTETFSIVSNDEWLHAVVDAENRLLFGIKAENGEVVMPKQDTYKVISNDEWLAAWIDSQDKILFGVKADGTFWAAKSNFTGGGNYDEQITQINNTLQQVQDQLKDIDTSGVANTVFTVIDDAEERLAVTIDKDGRVISYRNKDGLLHEKKGVDTSKYYLNGKERNFVDQTEVAGFTEEAIDDAISNGDISLENINGVSNHNTPNLLIADEMQKTFNDGTNSFTPPNEGYEMSNPIECQAGDWFTRTGTATGMVVVTDENDKNGTRLFNTDGTTLGNTFQIPEDMTWVRYIRMAVFRKGAEEGTVVICKGKEAFTSKDYGDYLTIPKLRVLSANIDQDAITFIKSNSGRYYQLQIDDSGESPQISVVAMEGIPVSELPSDFPTFKVSGDFSPYYDGLVFCPIEGGQTYLFELASNGLVKRFLKKKVNCPRVLKEGDTWYCYGVDGNLNKSTGKLNIFKANGETFDVVKSDLGNSRGEFLEPHDCLVLSISPLHYICQRYVPNTNVMVDGEQKVVIALHVEEVYEGKSVWEWHSEDYPELWTDSFNNGDNADYLHNNTICIGPDDNLYLNNKFADQILVIERTWNDFNHIGSIGAIKYKIGGRSSHSGYNVPTRVKPEGNQQWNQCHDAVIDDNSLITLFDNNGGNNTSRIIEFKIDTEAMNLTDYKAYEYHNYKGVVMGSANKCAEGIYLVSWGGMRSGGAANAGIYDFNTNKALFEIRFDIAGYSAYRVYGIPKG